MGTTQDFEFVEQFRRTRFDVRRRRARIKLDTTTTGKLRVWRSDRLLRMHFRWFIVWVVMHPSAFQNDPCDKAASYERSAFHVCSLASGSVMALGTFCSYAVLNPIPGSPPEKMLRSFTGILESGLVVFEFAEKSESAFSEGHREILNVQPQRLSLRTCD